MAKTTTSPNRRAAILLAVSNLTLIMLLLIGLAVANEHEDADNNPEVPLAVGHIHGIAVGPDDEVLVGAHFGLFTVNNGSISRDGDAWTDVMALSEDTSGALLASGHPDLLDREQPINLGLLRSTNAGKSWEPVALSGVADFHALDMSDGRTWGYDGVSGDLLTSTSQKVWQSIAAPINLIDIAVNPDNAAVTLVTTAGGRIVRVGLERDPQLLAGAPNLSFIDWPNTGELVGVAPNGKVYRSSDAGVSWIGSSQVPGAPTALSVRGDKWLVATDRGLYRTAADSKAEALFEYP